VGFLGEKMSNFEARIQRQKQAIEQKRKKKETEKQAASEQEKFKDNQKLDEIKKDERYIQMRQIAHSFELSEALNYIQMEINPQSTHPIKVHFYPQVEPVGVFHIPVVLEDGFTDDEYRQDPKGFSLVIQWRDKDTKRTQTKKAYESKGGAGDEYAGFDAEAGLGIELRKTLKYSESYDSLEEKHERLLKSKFFYDLNELIDYLASLIAEDTIEQANFLYNNFLFNKLA
jgi:hypothetical protein